jgi:hypothetical protein
LTKIGCRDDTGGCAGEGQRGAPFAPFQCENMPTSGAVALCDDVKHASDP